jgi:hypothetical protein
VKPDRPKRIASFAIPPVTAIILLYQVLANLQIALTRIETALVAGLCLGVAGVAGGFAAFGGNKVRVAVFTGSVLLLLDASIHLPAVFEKLQPQHRAIRARARDFDGDGRSDVAVFRSSSATWLVIQSSTDTAVQTDWGLEGDIPVPGDYDGDGKTDLAVYRSGTWHVLASNDGATTEVRWGEVEGDIPVPADYDGDGRTDIAVFRSQIGVWRINASTNGILEVQWGQAGDVPVPGDFDGDGKAEQAVYRSTTFFLRDTNGRNVSTTLGLHGDIPVVADYDGDLRTDIAVFRPSDGAWSIITSRTNTETTVWWGQKGDQPVPADYDGDGRVDPAIFRPSTGEWYQLRSTTATGFKVSLGLQTDAPL